MGAQGRGHSPVTIFVIITCSACISIFVSLEISQRHVSCTSMTKCVCADVMQWSRSKLEKREQEGGLVTVRQDPSDWAPCNASDLGYPNYNIKESRIAIQPRRKQHTINMCYKTLPRHRRKLSAETLKHLYVNEQRKFVYCAVPKAGCTNWKRILMALDNPALSVQNITRDEAHHSKLKTLASYPEHERKRILDNYTKFLFTRDPFVRLLSAYKDKFQGIRNLDCERHSSYFKNIAAEIMTQYRKNVSREALDAGEGVTWKEFMYHIIDAHDPASYNEHWQLTYSLCAPCNIRYDYIGKMESVHEDMTRLFRKIYIESNSRIYFPKSANPTVRDSEEFDEAFGELTVNELRKLWNIYELDFALFNYSTPNFLKSSIT